MNQILATSLGFSIPSVTLISCKWSEYRLVPSHSLCKITADECTSIGNKIQGRKVDKRKQREEKRWKILCVWAKKKKSSWKLLTSFNSHSTGSPVLYWRNTVVISNCVFLTPSFVFKLLFLWPDIRKHLDVFTYFLIQFCVQKKKIRKVSVTHFI